ncbi:C4-dicarboxylate ABC transporter [Thalassotalea loyana]|jgi:uncharacterized ion transporter superfamily protein YfcC|uniref:C4-dicarboxylate ABC transporter n=1 Tax=Thalassotalea loyana TaxID=280483 RepID=A0ABQ6HDE8_9GAMM|nr:YfcC family protein [Thalassotalea loyana]GLX86096.1 C4-dicarboxylate ABC transporter [Thalassotalea loyana]
MFKMKFPSVYTILVLLTILMAVLTWLVPAGQYQLEKHEAIDSLVPIAGTYQPTQSNPQGIVDILLAPVKGFYDPKTSQARAIDVALFVLIIGGFFGVVNKTKAIESGIFHITLKLKGKEIWMIPTLMGLFALGGTTFGMAEETLPFYTLIIPVMIAAGYDTITGVAVVMIGAGIGALGSTINPFATIIASNAAQVSFTEGLTLRILLLVAGWLLCAAYVMRYASKIKKSPQSSLVFAHKEENENYFLHAQHSVSDSALTLNQKLVLVVLCVTFIVMVWGVSTSGWWMAEISALFLGATILVGLIARMKEEVICQSFINGAKELLGVAFIIALARGLVVIMDEGNITHTFLFYFEQSLSDLSPIAFINAIYAVEAFLSLLIPSSSGLAVLSMPVLAPLADFVNVPRELVVTAYQAASGLPNLVTPTSAIVMGGLALGRVSYITWLKFIAPLLVALTVLVIALLSIGVVIY